MTDFFESESFVLPSLVRNDIAARFKERKGVKTLEFLMKGELLEDAKEFSEILSTLKKRGVKVSHDFSIKLEFPRTISRETALALVEKMPKSKNGSLKVRLELDKSSSASGANPAAGLKL